MAACIFSGNNCTQSLHVEYGNVTSFYLEERLTAEVTCHDGYELNWGGPVFSVLCDEYGTWINRRWCQCKYDYFGFRSQLHELLRIVFPHKI